MRRSIEVRHGLEMKSLKGMVYMRRDMKMKVQAEGTSPHTYFLQSFT
jgi:hypothetical protein